MFHELCYTYLIMSGSRQPKKVVGDIRVRTKILDPALHWETSRFVVDLRAAGKEKTAAVEVAHKTPPVWRAQIELESRIKNQELRKPDSKYLIRDAGKRFTFSLPWRRYRFQFGFTLGALLVALIIPALNKVDSALALKNSLLQNGVSAVSHLASAGQLLSQSLLPGGQNNAGASGIDAAKVQFDSAYANFVSAQEDIQTLGDTTLAILSAVPGLADKLAAGQNLLTLGQNVSLLGKEFANGILAFEGVGFQQLFTTDEPLTDRLKRAQGHLVKAQAAALAALDNLAAINPDALPASVAEPVSRLKEQVPAFRSAAADAVGLFQFLLGVLGEANPRKYIIVFQNNAEIRATGGFIGSYARLDFYRGRVEKFKVDDVYNIDGQLTVNVVPPRPLQKITGAWSFHDANWFFDFPASARKLAWFYEKTGGPTVDGVIAITPAVLEKLLAITGPITVPSANATFSAANVIDLLQFKVERDFDKTLNQPKTVVADLAAKILERLPTLDAASWGEVAKTILAAFREKVVLMWLRDPEEETFAQAQGWGGEVKLAPKDYLAVVNTNLNGYKTDKMIAQSVDLNTVIKETGEIINTLTITRTHLGGDEPYDWYNRVNSNYLRVYVPQGSTLLSAAGHTREKYRPPLDYEHLPFKIDPDVAAQEAGLTEDPATGTQIFTEGDKTVFGNWVYVSPGRTVSVVYQYQLPFTLDEMTGRTYSLLVQKQPGAKPFSFRAALAIPNKWQTSWRTPAHLRERVNGWAFDTQLNGDAFYGITLTR